jgi:hypothetical protein
MVNRLCAIWTRPLSFPGYKNSNGHNHYHVIQSCLTLWCKMTVQGNAHWCHRTLSVLFCNCIASSMNMKLLQANIPYNSHVDNMFHSQLIVGWVHTAKKTKVITYWNYIKASCFAMSHNQRSPITLKFLKNSSPLLDNSNCRFSWR